MASEIALDELETKVKCLGLTLASTEALCSAAGWGLLDNDGDRPHHPVALPVEEANRHPQLVRAGLGNVDVITPDELLVGLNVGVRPTLLKLASFFYQCPKRLKLNSRTGLVGDPHVEPDVSADAVWAWRAFHLVRIWNEPAVVGRSHCRRR